MDKREEIKYSWILLYSIRTTTPPSEYFLPCLLLEFSRNTSRTYLPLFFPSCIPLLYLFPNLHCLILTTNLFSLSKLQTVSLHISLVSRHSGHRKNSSGSKCHLHFLLELGTYRILGDLLEVQVVLFRVKSWASGSELP